MYPHRHSPGELGDSGIGTTQDNHSSPDLAATQTQRATLACHGKLRHHEVLQSGEAVLGRVVAAAAVVV